MTELSCLTKHLLKLNEIEDQFRQLTNKFEEVNFKLDKLSTRVTKIQSDNQLRFSDLESGKVMNPQEQKQAIYARYLNEKKPIFYEVKLNDAMDNLLDIAGRRILA